MTDTVMTTATEPDGAPRVASLDILRGIAILGILFMNINAMGGAILMMWMDVWRYGHSGLDEAAFFLRNTLADGTARCLLEMLFGVGMVILTDRASRTLPAVAPHGRLARARRWLFGDWAVMRSYYWRSIVLFAFGLIHVFILLWPGDILHTYGLAAIVAFLFRRLGPKWLLAIGLSMALFQAVGGSIGYVSATGQIRQVAAIEAKQRVGQPVSAAETATLAKAAKAKAARDKDAAEMRQRMTTEDAARGPGNSFTSWGWSAWEVFLYFEGLFLEPLWVLEAASTMLIGAALFKWGIIQGGRSRRFYAIMTALAYGFGLSVRAVQTLAEIAEVQGPTTFWATSELARLATTLGHIGVVHLLLGTVVGLRLLKPFEAAGRTALTIYVCQTIICLWVLYPPWGLALYGAHGWAAWMATALGVNAVLLLAANWYVTRYRIAPVEWAWRSIIAGKSLPIRRGAGSLAGGGVPAAA